MTEFARNLSYGSPKPRPHDNAAAAPAEGAAEGDAEQAVDGRALAAVPDADEGETREGAKDVESEAADNADADTDGDADAEADATGEADSETVADEAAEADETDEEATDEPSAEAAGDSEATSEAPDEPVDATNPDQAPETTAPGSAESVDTAEPTDSAELADSAEPEAPRPGDTTVADEVVEKVAGIAARKVPGVHELGGDASRLVNTVRERIGLGEGSSARGISVKLTGRTAKIAVVLAVEYGHPVYQVADQVRRDVGDAVEDMLGIEVAEVNIVVDDVHVPDA